MPAEKNPNLHIQLELLNALVALAQQLQHQAQAGLQGGAASRQLSMANHLDRSTQQLQQHEAQTGLQTCRANNTC